MKKALLILLFGLVSCASNPSVNTSGELRKVFDEFKHTVKKGSIEDQQKYFTLRMWADYQEFSQNPKNKTDEFASIVNSFPTGLKVEGSIEKIDGAYGCLIVQGKNRKNEIMDYIIEMIKQDNKWVFNDVSNNLYEPGQKRWLTEPVCSQESRLKLFMKYMQKQKDGN
jgi:hypothetical protein